MTVLLAFIAFDLIVIIHELGHFIVARLCNVKVHEFSLFFGPKLFSIKRGETMYSIRAIPALAYVKLEGEDEVSDSDRSFSKKSKSVRAAILFAGPFLNILLGLILFFVVFSIQGFQTTEIDTVVEGSPAYVAGLQTGDEIVRYDNKRIYQSSEVGMFLFGSKGEASDIEVIRNGERITKSIVPQVIPETTRYVFGFMAKAAEGENSNVVQEVDPTSPAGKAGLLAGDRIVKLNEKVIVEKKEIGDYLNQNKTKPVAVTVIRNGAEAALNITPVMQKNPQTYYIGIDFKTGSGGLIKLTQQSIKYTYSIVRISLISIVWLIQGQVPTNQMAGPVGIVTTMSDVVQQSPNIQYVFLNLMNISALISIALGVSNLLPIPPADGSKLLLIGVEAIRRKPLPFEKESIIMMIGFFIMMGLFVLLTYNDIARLIMRNIPGG